MTIDAKQNTRTTNSGRVRLPPVLTGIALMLLSCFASTQYIAARLGYQDALGTPLLQLATTRIYQPFGWLHWFVQYRNIENVYLEATFKSAAIILFIGISIAVLASLIYRHFLTRDLQTEVLDLHGSAHFADAAEVKSSGLLGNEHGVYVGGWVELGKQILHYLRHDGPEHVEVTAPTRSGKGVSVILPTLYGWEGSTVTHDIKGECYALSAGFRKNVLGHNVIRFDPTDPTGQSCPFNPIEEIRLGTDYEVADAMNIAAMIVDPDGKGMTDHWAKTGHELLSAGVLHVLYAEKNKTLTGLVSFFCDPSRTMEQVAEAMLTTEHDSEGTRGWMDTLGEPTRVHPMIAEAARSFLNKADNERSGVQSTAMSFLAIYRDPIVARNTSYCGFRTSDLMNSEVPTDLYIVNKPSDKSRLKPLIRLLMSQIIRSNVREMKFVNGRAQGCYKHRMLWLHDEAASTGRIEVLEDALPYMAGYGIKAMLIWQDRQQKLAAYGQNEGVSGQFHIRIAFAPNTIETAEWLSKMLGTSTRTKNSYTFSGRRSRSTMDQVSVSATEVSRPLMTPDEVMRLRAATKDAQGNISEPGAMIILIAGQAPILGTQILYFQDPVFSERSLMPAPESSDVLRERPAPTEGLPRPAIAAPTEPTTDDNLDPAEAAMMKSPPLDDSALASYGDEEHEEPAPIEALPPGVIVSDEHEEPELGAQLIVDPAELVDIEDEEDEEAHETAATADQEAGQGGHTDEYLAAAALFAAGEGLPDDDHVFADSEESEQSIEHDHEPELGHEDYMAASVMFAAGQGSESLVSFEELAGHVGAQDSAVGGEGDMFDVMMQLASDPSLTSVTAKAEA